MSEPILTSHSLSAGYRNGSNVTCVLHNVNVTLSTGQLTLLIGANGAGKSTLLRTLCGVQRPLDGYIEACGRRLSDYSRQQLSRLISICFTDRTLAGGLTVRELVSLGRQPHTGFLGRLDSHDNAVVAEAMQTAGIAYKADAYVAQLSDGERQKAMLAKSLAQATPIVILDEPTAFLDVASRLDTLHLLHRLATKHSRAIVLSTHDVAQALPYADVLWLVMEDGTLVQGTPDEMIESKKIDGVFSTRRHITFDRTRGDFVLD